MQQLGFDIQAGRCSEVEFLSRCLFVILPEKFWEIVIEKWKFSELKLYFFEEEVGGESDNARGSKGEGQGEPKEEVSKIKIERGTTWGFLKYVQLEV